MFVYSKSPVDTKIHLILYFIVDVLIEHISDNNINYLLIPFYLYLPVPFTGFCLFLLCPEIS